jgi:NAD(P)H-hydrate epimerase
VLVVGGARGMMGAALLAGAAAVRSGAGLVSVATHREHAVAVTAARPELMCYGVEDRQQLEALLQRASVVAIGPGLGQGRWGQMLWSHALESTLPLVVDADALNLLAAEPLRRDNWVLTPHPGEAGRLLQMSAQEVEQDPFAAVRCLQQRYGGVVVLKGAGSLVAEDTAPLTLIDAGNPGMACGGMGDVLTGVIGALLAQGLPLGDAARAGACMHAGAADAVAAAEGERGLAASDVVAMLRHFANPRHTHGH